MQRSFEKIYTLTKLFVHCIWRAASRAARTAGRSKPVRTPIIAISTSCSATYSPYRTAPRAGCILPGPLNSRDLQFSIRRRVFYRGGGFFRPRVLFWRSLLSDIKGFPAYLAVRKPSLEKRSIKSGRVSIATSDRRRRPGVLCSAKTEL